MKRAAKFAVGQNVVIQPSVFSAPLYGAVARVDWNESFGEFAYTVTLSNGETSTAWERDIKPARDWKAVSR